MQRNQTPLIDERDPIGIRMAEWGFRVLFTFYGFAANLLGALHELARRLDRAPGQQRG